MTSILEKQEALQKEAEEVLRALELLDFLADLGEAKVVGSCALGLMTRKDIDIDVAVDELKEGEYFQAVRHLFGRPEVKRLVLADNRNLSEKLKQQGVPESMYLGVFAKAKDGGEWKMDLRFVRGSLARAEKYITETRGRLDDEKRRVILEIKSVICTHPKYLNKEISSVDIYNSVLAGQVRSLDDFRKYLRRKKIEL